MYVLTCLHKVQIGSSHAYIDLCILLEIRKTNDKYTNHANKEVHEEHNKQSAKVCKMAFNIFFVF